MTAIDNLFSHIPEEEKKKERERLEKERVKGLLGRDGYVLLSQFSENQDQRVKVLSEAALRFPEDDQVLQFLLMNLDFNEEYERIINICEARREAGTADAFIYRTLSETYFKTDELTKMSGLIEEAKERGVADESLLLSYATQQRQAGNKKEAKKTLDELIRSGYNNASLTGELFLTTGNRKFLEKMEEQVEEDPGQYNALKFLADMAELKVLNPEKRTYFLKKITEQLKEDDQLDLRLEERIHATNTIMTGREMSLYTSFFTKVGEEPFTRDMEVRQQIEDLYKEEKFAFVPEFVNHFEHNGKYYYFTTYEIGRPLTELVKAEPHDLLGLDNMHMNHVLKFGMTMINRRVLNAICKLYTHFPTEELQEYDYRGKLEEKGYGEKVATAIEPFIQIMEMSENKTFFNDSWTDNWIIANNKFSNVDNEDRGLVPLAFDVAHYFTCVPQDALKESLVWIDGMPDLVEENLEKEGSRNKPIEDKNRFYIEFLAASIYRSLLNVSSRGEKEKRHDDAYMIAGAGLEAITLLEETGLLDEEDYQNISVLKETLYEKRMNNEQELLKQFPQYTPEDIAILYDPATRTKFRNYQVQHFAKKVFKNKTAENELQDSGGIGNYYNIHRLYDLLKKGELTVE